MTASTGVGRRWSAVTKNSPALRQFEYPVDYPQVLALWENAGPGIHVRRSDQPEEIAKKLQRDPDLFLVAEVEGQIIGSVVGGFDGRRGIVYHLAVAEAYRQQGLGAALMSELERRMTAKGCIRCYLMVIKGNENAIRFYEQSGWERMDLYLYGKDLD
jgi:ribosomal protein S18 acetylase RimI-like enzyme